MFRRLLSAPSPRTLSACLFCACRPQLPAQRRLLSATTVFYKKLDSSSNSDSNLDKELDVKPDPESEPKTKSKSKSKSKSKPKAKAKAKSKAKSKASASSKSLVAQQPKRKRRSAALVIEALQKASAEGNGHLTVDEWLGDLGEKGDSAEDLFASLTPRSPRARRSSSSKKQGLVRNVLSSETTATAQTLKEAMVGSSIEEQVEKKADKPTWIDKWLQKEGVQKLSARTLDFQPVHVNIPPVPKLAHGLDRVLFNPGTYRLQDPRSRIYNFDPYLEKIMPVAEFDFDALSPYKTSSKDEKLLSITKQEGAKFTGSTSSMSGVLQHFHYMLSNWRPLNHGGLSREFPDPNESFTKITTAPSAIFLRWKDGTYAVDADKEYDTPNVMSWLGHSLEKLLTTTPEEFERYRRSNPEQPPSEVESGKSYHYSKLGNFLMRSQLDAQDLRLPGTGVFDLKTRAVLPIRMNASEYEDGTGYQLRYDRGEWESFERENYDMTRATMLKYSLQVRMGRMDGIFVAYHNVESIFGFQYISCSDMDFVLHGQSDTCLGDQEFKLSVNLLDQMLQRAISKFPETSIRLHFETRPGTHPNMYVFAEPVTDEQIHQLQAGTETAIKEFEEKHIKGIDRDAVESDTEDVPEYEPDVVEESEDVSTLAAEAAANAAELEALEAKSAELEAAEATAAEKEESGDADVDTTKADAETLMGWILTSRTRVNGEYVTRATDLSSSDEYEIEYEIRDIGIDTRRKLYDMLLERRRKLHERASEEEVDPRLAIFRSRINVYTKKGRAWKLEQDKIDEQMGKRMYQPHGPGSENAQETGA